MKICLSMIVKNESQFIRSSLQSAIPYINNWVIVDTGSTDNTMDIIKEELGTKPGKLFHRDWVNYGTSRTQALQLAMDHRGDSDWVLILDADEVLQPQGDFRLNDVLLEDHCAYWMTVQYGSITYARPNLVSPKQQWVYEGVTHEYLNALPKMPPAVLLPVNLITHPSRCTKSIERCEDDARVLKKALVDEPENPRYFFYLAQSLRDSNKIEEAITQYQKRADMGGWYEEKWYAAFQVACLKERQDYPQGDIVNAYLVAYDLNPARSEPLGALARYFRMRNRYSSALLVSEKAKGIVRPDQLLFLDDSYYQWRCMDEYAIAAYWTGHFQESRVACEFLLNTEGRLPQEQRDRVQKNLAFAEEKLK